MYYASGEGFNKWQSLLVQDEAVAALWQSGIAGELQTPLDKMRFRSMAMMLFTTLENSFHQVQLGSHDRKTLEISKSSWGHLLTSPGGGAWWRKEAHRSFTPEFVEAVEALIPSTQTPDSSDNAV